MSCVFYFRCGCCVARFPTIRLKFIKDSCNFLLELKYFVIILYVPKAEPTYNCWPLNIALNEYSSCRYCLCNGKCYVLCVCRVESVVFCIVCAVESVMFYVFVWKVLCSLYLCSGKCYVLCVCAVERFVFCVFLWWKGLCTVCLCGKCYVLCVCVVESVMFCVPRSSRSLAPVLGDIKQSKWGQETAVHWRLSLICCQSSPGLAVSNMPTPWRLASTIRRLKWQWVERWHVRWMLFGIFVSHDL